MAGKRINSKAKGNTYERKISNLLSERFKEKTGLEKSFTRNADSGSFFGGKNKARVETHSTDKATFGDIITPAAFKFTVECKHYKDAPTMNAIIAQNVKLFDEWLIQAKQDSVSANKDFVIICKFNNVSDMVILDKLIGGLTSIINYKEYFIISLDSLLKLDDSYFFEDKIEKSSD